MNLTVLENRNMILLKICSPGKGLSIHVTIVRFNKILAILCFLEKLMILLKIGEDNLTSRLLTSSLSLGVPVPRPTQCMGGA